VIADNATFHRSKAAERGALVAQEDIKPFAAQVRRLLDDAELRRRVGEAGRVYARQWNARDPAKALLAFYQDLRDEHAQARL
jgi:glycosyltransferase involved in cell wall biosynthesis